MRQEIFRVLHFVVSRQLLVVSYIMKLIIKLIILAGILYLGSMFFFSKNSNEPLLSLSNESGNVSFNIRDKEKEEFKKYLKKLKNLIYREATNHNPAGDVLPDNIDNNLIEDTKKIVN